MPKKSASARNAAQRNKPRTQKSVELVRQTFQEKDTLEEKEVTTEAEAEDGNEAADAGASTAATLDTPSTSADVKKVSAKKDRKSTRLNSSHVRISYAVF